MKISAIMRLDVAEFVGPLKRAADDSRESGSAIQASLGQASERLEGAGQALGRMQSQAATGTMALRGLGDDAAASAGRLNDLAEAAGNAGGKIGMRLDVAEFVGPLKRAADDSRESGSAIQASLGKIGMSLDVAEFVGPLKRAADDSRESGSAIQASLGQSADRADRAAQALARMHREASSGQLAMRGLGDDAATASGRLDDVADKAGSASGKIGEMGMQAGQIRQLTGLLAGMSLEIGGAALKAAGQDRAADYLSASGGKALQYGLTTAMVTKNPYATVGAMAVGAGLGAFQTYAQEQAEAREEAERLDKAMRTMEVGAASALRSLSAMDSADQAAVALRRLREEYETLQDRMERGLDEGPLAEARMGMMEGQIGRAEYQEAALRRVERSENIGEARGALAAFDEGQSAALARQAFDSIFKNAGSTAERVEMVNRRMDEFSAASARLRAELERTEVQTDPKKFTASLQALGAAAGEIMRLRGLDTVVKAKASTERPAQIATDSLARIGGFVGGSGRMEGLSERTAKAGEKAERWLQRIAERMPGRMVAAWA